jgi:hypothetical protein
LCARPLHYHSFPDHLYWQSVATQGKTDKDTQTPDVACYTRSDNGWAEGMHPTDVFLKNTQEVLGPLHAATAHDRLTQMEFLTKDFTVRQATYGSGQNATKTIVNFGTTEAQITSKAGGNVALPPFGFVIEGPRFVAFYATRWGGEEYPRGALFTVRAMDNKDLNETGRARIFHGFGTDTIRWKGELYKVQREQVVQPR